LCSSIQFGKNAHKSALWEQDRHALISPPVLGSTPGFSRPRTIHLQRTPALLPVGGGFNFVSPESHTRRNCRFGSSPTQKKVILCPRGRSERVSAMTRKVITMEFVVPTALAVALGIALSISAVYLIDRYLLPVDQLEADYSFVSRR
jgi:hypothetical protein